jgi:hypothetical protein
VRYSIDTSAILDGWRRYYPPDVFPGRMGSARRFDRRRRLDRPNIPDVCAARGLRCISVLQLLHDDGWKFAR